MERPKWHRPSKNQLGFDFGQRSLQPSPLDEMRFTYAVNEEIEVLSPADAGHYLLTHVFTPFDTYEQEEVWLLLLNNRNKITHQSMVYRGTINTSVIRVAEVYKPAIRLNAASIILAHCHPSSDLTPSPQDIAVTQQIYDAGKLLQVELLDHLILGQGCWLSLKARGLGFEDAVASTAILE